MKSIREDLRNRGLATEQEIMSLRNTSKDELIRILHSENASHRTAAATIRN